jgi:CheY-like chemotaxis protein
MDTRKRVLVVEDIADMRATVVEVLERENLIVHSAATAEEAIAAAERRLYHLALIDISLAGKDDASDREGVLVLKRLRELGEGTQSLVLSGQRQDIPLVRDLLKDYGAVDYVAKWELQDKGNAFLVSKVNEILRAQKIPGVPEWRDLTRVLTQGSSESVFVSECLRLLEFKGGFDNLSRSLINACEHLVPLLIPISGELTLSRQRVSEVFNGAFWSKGQGLAIDLLLFGKNVSPDAIDREWNLSAQEPLYSRTKAGLSVVIRERRDLTRDKFTAATDS